MDNPNKPDATIAYDPLESIQHLEQKFSELWQRGTPPRIEEFVSQVSDESQGPLVQRLVAVDVRFRRSVGDDASSQEYQSRLSGFDEQISRAFEMLEAEAAKTPGGVEQSLVDTRSFADSGPTETADFTDPSKTAAPTQSFDPTASPAQSVRAGKSNALQFGRYRVVRELGNGGFGVVYLATDDELQRQVAIKVAKRGLDQQDAESYLSEARTVATLDHTHIVPVYDVGRNDEGQIYVVSRFVEGSDLNNRIKQERPLFRQAVTWVATLADALHYAHTKGLVHRDVKPANVLLDQQGQAYLCDFGLALREEHYGQGPTLAGTPAYMSPEQARGEGHRVDGRSDIYSLGVVLYELLTGKRPFSGDSMQLLRSVAHDEPRPPRQIDDSLPPELERITLKCMAKRASDRYTTAADLAEDLRAFLDGKVETEKQAVKIVPKGLRSFDARDSDFFIDLLPGVRDRGGLPDSITFWKHRLEERDADQTFGVGMICGPSGCGKSSLVKAGLLPRLAETVRPVYIEATADNTEARLLAGLHKACPEMPQGITLKDAVARLRLGQSTRASRKVVLILDQFEQWLYARNEYGNTELADALRQCDGGNVQAIVMVRDDFWMAASRLFRDLDVPLVERHNTAAVDLFDLIHARKVLAEFGKAYGRLPENLGQLSADQERFLDDAVTGLSTDGKVISVRLALFAEMVKGKPWTPSTLRQLGGISGVGVVFLEETFSATSASPAHRHHQQAARAVLSELLPDEATNIKGRWRSDDQLRQASGYADRPSDFADLIRILDTQLRLITPTDPEGAELDDEAAPVAEVKAGAVYYQLTHDFLVPSLRAWLTQKQQETRKGRAELKLAERTNLWTAKPENRYLPSLVEWFNIRTLTDRKRWTSPEQSVMQRAGRVHGSRIALGLTASVLLLFGGLWTKARVDEEQAKTSASGLVAALLSAETRDVPKLVAELTPYRQWADPELQTALESTDTKTQLHARIALLPVDTSQVEPLQTALLDTTPENVLVLREVLQASGDQIAESYWPILESTENTNQKRLSAGAALAKFAPTDDRWKKVAGPVSNLLVNENPLRLATWIEAFRPVRTPLIPELGIIFRDQTEAVTPTQRELATNLLETYAADNVDQLSELILDAQPKQFAALFDEFKAFGSVAKNKMVEVIDRQPTRSAMWDTDGIPSLEEHPVRNSDRALIKAADGMLTDNFALVQTMSRANFEKLTNSLAESGYRPTKIRPSWIDDAVNIAAVWHRDGRKSTYSFDHTAESFTEFDKTQRSGEMVPADIAGYIDRTTSPPVERYLGLWEPSTPETSDREFFIGELEPEYQKHEYAHVAYQSFQGLAGEPVISGIKRAGSPGGSRPSFQTLGKDAQVPYQSSITGLNTDNRSDEAAAITELTEKIMAKPDDWFQLLRRAKTHARSGDFAAALVDLDAVLGLQPKCIPAICERLLCHLALKNRDKANEDFEQLKSLPIGEWERRFFEQLLSDKPDVESLSDPTAETRIDLLRCVDVTRHSAGGRWSRIDGVIESPLGVAKLNVPVVPKSSYRLHLVVSPSVPPEGKKNVALILGLVVGDKRFYLEFGDRVGAFLELEGGQKVETKTKFELKPETLYTIEVAVADGAVNVLLDGEMIIEWKGNPAELSTKPYWETPEFCLTFNAYEANYQFLNAVLELEGDAKCKFLESNAAQENRMLEGSLWAEYGEQPALAEKLATGYFDSLATQSDKLRSDVYRSDVKRAFSRLKPPIDPRLAYAFARLSIGWSDDHSFEGKWTQPSSPGDHATECLAYETEGFVPVAIDVNSVAGSTFATSVWHRKAIASESINQLERQKANAVTALARLNDREKLFAGLRVTDNPEALTQFVHRCRESGVTPIELLEMIRIADETRQSIAATTSPPLVSSLQAPSTEPTPIQHGRMNAVHQRTLVSSLQAPGTEPTPIQHGRMNAVHQRKIEDRVLFGLLLALGEFPLSDIPESERSVVLDKVADWFANDPSSAIHGATGWLLRQWGQTEVVKRVDQTPLAYDPNREWFTLAIDAGDQRFYQTYVVIPPGEYEIGSPLDEPGRSSYETTHRVRLTRPVAILDREVTVGEWKAAGIDGDDVDQYSPTLEHPIGGPSWYGSVQYCRWLTERAGFTEADQAYADPTTLDKATYPLDGDSGSPKNWPVNLAKPGFRLPTEAEWEIAARAGMRSMYGFGADESLLGRYAWYQDNSNRQTHIAKELRPNLEGLFDMHGNLFEWTHNWFTGYATTTTQVDPKGGQTGANRVLRGGSWGSVAAYCRTAYRNANAPTYRITSGGLRLAVSPSVQRAAEPSEGEASGAEADR